jgi:Bacterial protein of unknown function (DUF916)
MGEYPVGVRTDPARRRWRPAAALARAGALGATIAVASLSILTTGPAGAVGVSGNGSQAFGANPVPLPDGQQRSFFDLTIGPGQSTTDQIVVTNQDTSSQTLKLSPSTGATAPNSGDAYVKAFEPCAGTGCWVSGIPSTVTLAAGGSQTIPFTVTVPGGTATQQYLAGITIQPNTSPTPQKVGSSGSASAQAIIVHQINIGVAITVGALSSMTTSVAIPGVAVTVVGSTPRLNIQEKNTGQRFFSGNGNATCTVNGSQLNLPFTSDTVLPGDTATLAVNAPGLPLGSAANCSVSIGSGIGQSATWSGTVAVPGVTSTSIVRTGPNSYTVVSTAGTPTWAIVAMTIGAMLVVLLAIVLIVLLRRRRGAPPGPVAPVPTPAVDGGNGTARVAASNGRNGTNGHVNGRQAVAGNGAGNGHRAAPNGAPAKAPAEPLDQGESGTPT